MSEINLPHRERDALKAIDSDVLDKIIEKCFYDERPDALRTLRLGDCGLYVASKLQGYEKALAEYSKAKMAKKRAETEYSARRAADDLVHAVRQMKYRVETEEKEELLFSINDQIMPPYHFSEHITVRISYRWRRTVEEEWVYASIIFSHNVDSRPDYTMPVPSRKLSAAKQEQNRQEKLYREWDHLKRQGLYSLKKYFQDGGDGALIPQTFQAIPDSHSGGLNNFSAQFWPLQS